MVENLEVGMKLHATYDGAFYPATVVAVSESKKRAKAPVKVHYEGYGDELDAWLGIADLKSKKLPAAASKGREKGGNAKAKVDLSVLTKGTSLQAMASDGIWYAAEVVKVVKAKNTVKVNFVGYASVHDEMVGPEKVRSKLLRKAVREGSSAKPKLTTKEVQLKKVMTQDGFFAALDQSGGSTPKALKIYGIEESEYSGDTEMMDKVHEMRSRIITNPKFNGSRVIGAILFEATMDREISKLSSARYLWNKKRVVPFLKIDKGLAEEKDGVQMMKPMPQLDDLLDKASAAGIFGTKERSLIKAYNEDGINAVVDQQFEVGKQIIAKGLVPMLEPEVDINAADKCKIENFLLDALMNGLNKLSPDEKVMFKLTIPTKPNLYLPLMGHPNTVRVVALSGGYDREEACKRLKENAGMIASFSRAFAEGMNVKQTDAEFTETMDKSCQAIFDASRALKKKAFQMVKVSQQPGFFSALDQSGGSTPKALKLYGIEESEYSGDAEMMDKVHEMRARIITNPKYHGGRVIGAILFEATMDRQIGMQRSAKYLWEQKRVVPFLKIDKGLAELKDGVQMMKDMPELDKLLDKAVRAGIFGTKERSVIKEPNEAGIKAAAAQQFEIGERVIAKGLVPMLEPEVDINATDKAKCEDLLLPELLDGLKKLEGTEKKVIFKLTIPSKANLYVPLQEHPNCVRVVALSGGYDREQSCKMLAENNGMIASFSRAFAEGLSAKQSDEEFTNTMDKSCQMIYEASRT